jgi:hypothetical protein
VTVQKRRKTQGEQTRTAWKVEERLERPFEGFGRVEHALVMSGKKRGMAIETQSHGTYLR